MTSSIRFGDANSGFQAGIIHGPVHTEFHQAAERPETPPKPSSTVPFRRDADFVDRKTVLDQIHQKCAISGSWTALVGLGGVGKSQLAIEYAYRTRERWLETWVFWVHASNAARFEQSFRDIANCVKIPGRQNSKADIFQLVHDWLRNESKGRWLLILDNVDNAEFLLDSQPTNSGNVSKQLREYLPQSENGCILITTRSREAALKLVEPYDIIDVDPMDKAHALELFDKKLGVQEDNKDVAELATALEFMPLAIFQAAAYITERAPRCSVRQYLEQFRKSDRKRTSLLDHGGGQLRRDREAKNSIILTWQISFDYIRQTRPSAADLLSLMCLFDRQGIPEALLRSRSVQGKVPSDQKECDNDDEWDGNEVHSSQSSQSDEFEEDVMTLRNFSFISVKTDGTTFEMHSLVQLATRKWLEAYGQLEKWKQQFIRNLYESFPTGDYETWAVCQALFPHAKSAATQQPDEESSLVQWASLLNQAAWYAYGRGRAADTQELAEKSVKARKKVYGEEHEDTLSSVHILAFAYMLRGQWNEVEALELEALKISERVLGPEHPVTLSNMSNLALTYMNTCRLDEAEDLEVQVLETKKRVLGLEHPSTLASMANLASAYRDKGQWDDAEKIQTEEIQVSKRVLGPTHPDTLISLSNLVTIYIRQGRWNDAEELCLKVIETRKRVLGDEHPDTLTSMSKLALIYNSQDRWNDAEDLDLKVIEAYKRVLGDEHPDTLTSISNLASTYENQGRWDDAEELGLKVVEARKRVLGDEHLDTLTSMSNLASIYSSQGRWNKAEELSLKALKARKRVLEDEHPDMLSNMSNLVWIYNNQGRWKEAEELGLKVVDACKRVFGDEHPNTLICMSNLALTFWNEGRWDDTEELEVQVMESRVKKLGTDHWSTLTSMNNLAFTWKKQGKNVEAIQLMRECVCLQERKLGADHPNFVFSLQSLKDWEAEQTETRAPAHEGIAEGKGS